MDPTIASFVLKCDVLDDGLELLMYSRSAASKERLLGSTEGSGRQCGSERPATFTVFEPTDVWKPTDVCLGLPGHPGVSRVCLVKHRSRTVP